MVEEGPVALPDGSAAEMNENPVCIVAGCPVPPVTHREMRVSVPIYGPGSDGDRIIVDRQEQDIQAALCAPHAEMLVDPAKVSAPHVIAIHETTGSIE